VVQLPAGVRDLYLPDRPWGLLRLLFNEYLGFFYISVKRQERETDHSIECQGLE